MSKTLQATCSAGVVKVGTTPLPNAVKLSKGVGASSGVAVLDEDKQYYLANTTPDLEKTLDEVKKALDKAASGFTNLVTIITAIGAGMTGPTTAPPPTLATDLVAITQVATDITAVSTALALLKGNLQ